MDWGKIEDLVKEAFVDHNSLAVRNVLSVAQFVVLGQRFGVETARSPG